MGITFTFNLPLAKVENFESTRKKPQTEVSSRKAYDKEFEEKVTSNKLSTDRLQQDYPRILAIDDEPINLKVIESILDEGKYVITPVLFGEEALNLLDIQEWDLVIADVMMPEMSGYELTRKIRNRFSRSELPVLLLTARNRQEDIKNGFLAGANDYITKPIDSVELRSRVHALTEAKQSFRERI